MSLKEFLTRAVQEQLGHAAGRSPEKPWMAAFGGLHDLHRETKRVGARSARNSKDRCGGVALILDTKARVPGEGGCEFGARRQFAISQQVSSVVRSVDGWP
jgi:hypothetical protein